MILVRRAREQDDDLVGRKPVEREQRLGRDFRVEADERVERRLADERRLQPARGEVRVFEQADEQRRVLLQPVATDYVRAPRAIKVDLRLQQALGVGGG